MELIFVPIERLDERYSSQWYNWFMRDFASDNIFPIVVGDKKKKAISTGQFLDVFDTNRYKAKQISQIIDMVCLQGLKKVFFMDLWFPSLEMLAYIRDGADVEIKIAGILHAGTWDCQDFLTRKGMDKWAKDFERSILTIADEIYVATNFHKSLIEDYFGQEFEKIKIVRFPVYFNKKLFDNNNRQDIVLFPHRLAPEKQQWVFEQLEELYCSRYPKIKFIKTKDVCKTKADYYNLMSVSKVVFSSALQETFGIAMLEGVNCGCLPVAPNRLSYRETLSEFGLYNDIKEAVEMVRDAIVDYKKPFSRYSDSTKEIVKCIKKL